MSRRAIGLALASLLFLGACGGDGGGGDGHAHEGGATRAPEQSDPPFEAADADTTVDVTLQDYAFVGVPSTPVAGPNVFLEAKIKGSNTHEVEVVDAAGETVGEIPAYKGSETASLAVVLPPGTYTLQCLVKEGARTHADLGMRATLTVS